MRGTPPPTTEERFRVEERFGMEEGFRVEERSGLHSMLELGP
jgi:hypothetical protein